MGRHNLGRQADGATQPDTVTNNVLRTCSKTASTHFFHKFLISLSIVGNRRTEIIEEVPKVEEEKGEEEKRDEEKPLEKTGTEQLN